MITVTENECCDAIEVVITDTSWRPEPPIRLLLSSDTCVKLERDLEAARGRLNGGGPCDDCMPHSPDELTEREADYFGLVDQLAIDRELLNIMVRRKLDTPDQLTAADVDGAIKAWVARRGGPRGSEVMREGGTHARKMVGLY